MSKGIFRAGRMMVLSSILAGVALLGGWACTGNAGVNTVLGTISNTAKQNTLMVRVVNHTSYDVEVEIRVDGDLKVLPLCTAMQGTCDYVLVECPGVVEILQESRYDSEELFMGGRNFEANPAFIFTQDQFDCGDTILLQFSETSASAQAL